MFIEIDRYAKNYQIQFTNFEIMIGNTYQYMRYFDFDVKINKISHIIFPSELDFIVRYNYENH